MSGGRAEARRLALFAAAGLAVGLILTGLTFDQWDWGGRSVAKNAAYVLGRVLVPMLIAVGIGLASRPKAEKG